MLGCDDKWRLSFRDVILNNRRGDHIFEYLRFPEGNGQRYMLNTATLHFKSIIRGFVADVDVDYRFFFLFVNFAVAI